MSGKSYLALVGYPFSWVAFPLSLCLYYNTFNWICQGVFEKIFKNLFTRGGRYHFHQQSPLTIFIISQTFRFVNTFFKNFFVKEEFPLSCYLGTDFHSTHFLSGSLTTVIISQQVVFVKCFFNFFFVVVSTSHLKILLARTTFPD